MENAIEIKNLTKKYGDKTVVNNLSLVIKKNELFSLLGLNGAGKTTTIKMLSGLIASDSGTAIIHGNDLNKDLQKIKNIINVSPQETAVAPNLTVKENLEFIAQIYGIKKNDIKKKIDELSKSFHLESYLNQKAKTLSGGLMRRLSIALAIITDPEILFLDEPTLGLDVRARHDLWNIINTLKNKMTIILTTHYLEEAESLSDHIAIIDQGILKTYGTITEIKKNTKSKNLESAFLKLTESEF